MRAFDLTEIYLFCPEMTLTLLVLSLCRAEYASFMRELYICYRALGFIRKKMGLGRIFLIDSSQQICRKMD